jgi:hypothetical protein
MAFTSVFSKLNLRKVCPIGHPLDWQVGLRASGPLYVKRVLVTREQKLPKAIDRGNLETLMWQTGHCSSKKLLNVRNLEGLETFKSTNDLEVDKDDRPEHG